LTQSGQLATRVLTLRDTAQTITPSATLLQAEVEELGDGRTIKTEVQVDTVFGGKTLGLEKPDVTPTKFRAVLPATTEEITVPGVVGPSIALGANELAKNEQQLTVLTKRVRAVTRDPAAEGNLFGQVYTTDLGGGVAQVIERFGPNPQTDVGFGTISSEKEALGDNNFVTREVKLAEPPILTGQVYDEGLDIVVPYTQTILPPTTSGLGEPRIVVEPRDVHHSLKRELNVSDFITKALNEHWQVAALVNVDLPDVLNEVVAVSVVAKSFGATQGSGTSFSLRASGTTSNTINIRWDITNGYKGPVPATRHVFYLPKTNALINAVLTKVNAQSFPAVFPRPVVLTTISGSVTKDVSFSQSISVMSADFSTASGASFGNSLTSNITVIPPTLHAGLTIQDEPITLTSSGDPNSEPGSGGVSVNAANGPSFEGDYSPKSIAATTPSSFPAGNYLVALETESFKFGLVRVTAVVAHINSNFVTN